MAEPRSVKRLLVKRRLKRLVKKPVNPRNTKNNNAAGRGGREERWGASRNCLTIMKRGTTLSFFLRPRKGEHSPHFPSSRRRFGFFVTFQPRNGRIITLSLSLSTPSSTLYQREARNNENVIFRDSYYHHRQDTVSSTPLLTLPFPSSS